jgi:hypothetical protein
MDPSVVEKVYLSAFGLGSSQHGAGADIGTRFQGGNGADIGIRYQGGYGADIGTRFQGGYGMPMYQGGSYYYRQHGRGIGSILRGIGRFLLPILINGGMTAAGAFMQGRKEGKNIGESIKGALGPAAGEAMRTGAEQVDKFVGEQRGSGRRRRHRGRRTAKGSRHQKVHSSHKKLYKTKSKHSRGHLSHAAAKKVSARLGLRNHFNF